MPTIILFSHFRYLKPKASWKCSFPINYYNACVHMCVYWLVLTVLCFFSFLCTDPLSCWGSGTWLKSQMLTFFVAYCTWQLTFSLETFHGNTSILLRLGFVTVALKFLFLNDCKFTRSFKSSTIFLSLKFGFEI